VIASTVLIVLLMMGAESTRNMYSNLSVKNKYDCLKLHHVGYLIKQKFKRSTTKEWRRREKNTAVR
jgi:hypothetical protein